MYASSLSLLSSFPADGPLGERRDPPHGGPVLEQREAGDTIHGHLRAHGPRRPAPGVQRARGRQHRSGRGAGARGRVPDQRLRRPQQHEERARERPGGHQ